MISDFSVRVGNEDRKNILVDILHTKGEKKTGLSEFLIDLEDTIKKNGNWWIAFDEYDRPRGALSVRQWENTSYLRSLWTRVIKLEDQLEASEVLIQQWIQSQHDSITRFQVDIPMRSPLVKRIEEVGFSAERVLLTIYVVDVDWMDTDLPEGYLMRPIEADELSDIYDSLIEPDLDPASKLYISKWEYTRFVENLSIEDMHSWVVVEDDKGKRVGFGASFLTQKTKDEEPDTAVLFGPHSTESRVQQSIIKEMMTYWKSQGISKLKVMRVSPFYPSVLREIPLKQIHSTVRYIHELP